MARSPQEEMILIGFLQAQNCSILTASWRHPDTIHGFLDARLLSEHCSDSGSWKVSPGIL